MQMGVICSCTKLKWQVLGTLHGSHYALGELSGGGLGLGGKNWVEGREGKL